MASATAFASYLLFMFLLWMPVQLEHARADFVDNQRLILTAMESDVLRHVLARDYAALYSSLDQQMSEQSRAWRSLTITLENGRRLYPLFARKEDSAPNLATDVQINHTIALGGRPMVRALLSADWRRTRQQAYASAFRLVAFLGIAFVIMLAIGLWLLDRLFRRPLLQLAQSAEMISDGNFDVSLPRAGSDELGALTRMFDLMRRRLDTARTQLIEAKNAAEAATRAKSDFLANMSHEVRTPMNAILGMSRLTLQMELAPKQRRYIDNVHRSAEGLLRIIDDILDFSKIESGHLKVEAMPFRLDDVMGHLANMVGLCAQEKGIELMFDVAADVPADLIGDPLRLRQILVNLGNNAVKFTDSGGEVTLAVALERRDRDVVSLHFSVRDSGIGITSEQQSRLFQPFTQADTSTTREYGGTGLGLVISKSLVELLGGSIWVDSVAGVGSIFHFTAEFRAGEPVDSRPDMLPARSGGYSALVVDDNAAARELLVKMLTRIGFEVEQTGGGEAALGRLTERCFDVVLINWQMPATDGLAVARRVREGGYGAKRPLIVMVTAYAREELRRLAGDLVPDAVLTKPVLLSSLRHELGRALGLEIATNQPGQTSDDALEAAAARLRGARLLLVEDNPINQELAVELLTGNGISVTIANNGREALARVKAEPFDGVLMDIQMPLMDGYTATRRIREQPEFEALPIIAMTANAMSGDREKALEAGMNDHIAKPIDYAVMITTLAHWVKPADAAAAVNVATTTVAAPECATSWSDLPGVDTAAGLEIVRGKEQLYRRLLVKFRDSERDFESRFREAQAARDTELVRRIAHTLKGTAGSLGIGGVSGAASALEQAVVHHDGDIEAKFVAVVREMDRVIAGLDAVLEGA